MVPPCDRWPVYLWSPAASEPNTRSRAHTSIRLSPRPGDTRRSSGNSSKSGPDTWMHYSCSSRCSGYSSLCLNNLRRTAGIHFLQDAQRRVLNTALRDAHRKLWLHLGFRILVFVIRINELAKHKLNLFTIVQHLSADLKLFKRKLY